MMNQLSFDAIGMQKAAKIFKYYGGKHMHRKHILAAIHRAAPEGFGCYYEPFAGSASIFFALSANDMISSAAISDIDPDPMDCLCALRDNTDAFISRYRAHVEFVKANEPDANDAYWRVLKEADNSPCAEADWAWRKNVGAYGEINSPGFHQKDGKFTGEAVVASLDDCARALRNAHIQVRDWRDIKPQAGDLVYADPPYHKSSNARFKKRDKALDSDEGHIELHDHLSAWNAQGVTVVISNSDTPFIQELYADWQCIRYPVRYRMGKMRRSYENVFSLPMDSQAARVLGG